jgi:alkylated DNA repair dioxygenase AlkB
MGFESSSLRHFMTQSTLLLFATPQRKEYDLPRAKVSLITDFIQQHEAQDYFNLLSGLPWRQDSIVFGDKTYNIPRLQQWFGDPGTDYTYSGLHLKPEPWVYPLTLLRLRAQAAAQTPFNAVLVNFYRNGDDSIAWHSDSEREFGPSPTIASLSLGATRDFVLRDNSNKENKVTIPLSSGSLLLMAGETQEAWQHSVPKRSGVGPRINLTFRNVINPSSGKLSE